MCVCVCVCVCVRARARTECNWFMEIKVAWIQRQRYVLCEIIRTQPQVEMLESLWLVQVYCRCIAGLLQVYCRCITGELQVYCRCITCELQVYYRCIATPWEKLTAELLPAASTLQILSDMKLLFLSLKFHVQIINSIYIYTIFQSFIRKKLKKGISSESNL
jgi:hypothetical protein